MSDLGTPVAFQIFAGLAVVVAFIYYLIFKLFFLPRQQKLDTLRREINNMPIRTVSTKDHRRNSVRYDKNLIVHPAEEEGLTSVDSHVAVREATKDDGDMAPVYRYQPVGFRYITAKQEAPFPTWSDDDDEDADCTQQTAVYENVEMSPSSSTPKKQATTSDFDCDLSDVKVEPTD